MTERIVRSKLFHRALDMLIPALSWFLITLPLWLSPFHPAVVAYFIIAFDLYFFYKAAVTTYRAALSYKEILFHNKIPYDRRLKKLAGNSDILHFVVIPNFKEPIHKLDATLSAITKNDFPYKNIYLVLAFEEREKEATEKAEKLSKKYRGFFKNVFSFFHPLMPGEEEGKASNQTYACRQIEKFVDKNKLDGKKIMITICDADSFLPKNYFSYLTFEFLRDRDRLYHFYWAPVLLYNNFWKVPLFVRLQATLSSILRLAFLSQKENLIQCSTYSTSFWLLKQVNFWDVDIIPEDWHIYFQAFFAFGVKVRTIPLFTIVNGDAVYSGGWFKTLTNRYEQEKRWAWGVSDVGYVLKRFFLTPHIDFMTKLKKALFISETHLLWPVSFFILTVSASIPPLINPSFKRTVMGFILPQLSALILTLSSAMLIIYIYLDIKLRGKVNQKNNPFYLPVLIIQWYLLPLVSFFFSSLPALDAHTRILLGKKLKYKVTEKV